MLGVVGINHKSGPLQLRERLVFKEEEIVKFMRDIQSEMPPSEVVVLSTCNRTELYFNLPDSCVQKDFNFLIRRLTDFKGIQEDVSNYFYSFSEREAVIHLFNVAGGLNSMVLGENQVLGQVKEAYRISASQKGTSTILNRLFHRAFEVGKRVRTDTAINEGASSISYAAVELASKIFSRLEDLPVLLIGAGETGELVLQSLVERGNRHIHVANRTTARAQELAVKYRGEAAALENLLEYLVHCDIIITSTAAPEPMVSPEAVKEAMGKRHHRTIFFIDLSVPRDVVEDVKELENVFVYNIDDLETVVAHNYQKRKREIEKAQKIISQYSSDFFGWLSSLNLSPTITGLKDKFSSLGQGELATLKNKLTEEEFRKVVEFADFLQGKYLGLIVKNLKKISKNGQRLDYIDMVNQLFELDGGGKG
jgi:glutamyl-tRNA reductase